MATASELRLPARRRTALISVTHKQGIASFARELVELGFDLIGSKGTVEVLAAAGVAARDVAEIVGGGPILGHRVVTLSREVHAGLLALLGDIDELERLSVPFIELACVDFYELEQAIHAPGATRQSVINATDIGGPAMARSAAKGERIIICDPSDRGPVLRWLKEGEPDREAYIQALGAKAEFVSARYALASARYHGNGTFKGIMGTLVSVLRYGENACQAPAGLYVVNPSDKLAVPNFVHRGGAMLGYNNWCDVDRALQTMTHVVAAFTKNGRDDEATFIAIVGKHGNACGAAVSAGSPGDALRKAVQGNELSAFGGALMVNFTFTDEHAELLRSTFPKVKFDVIVAPEITNEAIAVLERKGGRCKFLVNPWLGALEDLEFDELLDHSTRIRHVRGGFLAQPNYDYVVDVAAAAGDQELSSATMRDLCLAWAVCATSNSNTITLAKNGMVIGNGVGQQDRVECAKLATRRAFEARHDTRGAVAASDSFFPFPDGPEVLCNSGVTAILATSGSQNDQKTIDVCAAYRTKLLLVPDTIGRGFFGH